LVDCNHLPCGLVDDLGDVAESVFPAEKVAEGRNDDAGWAAHEGKFYEV
jgi:hypothetical protein